MASNLQLTELEQAILDWVKITPNVDATVLRYRFAFDYDSKVKVDQALSNLISNSFISADENLRYSAVGKEI